MLLGGRAVTVGWQRNNSSNEQHCNAKNVYYATSYYLSSGGILDGEYKYGYLYGVQCAVYLSNQARLLLSRLMADKRMYVYPWLI